jgi:hypothetical protein
VLVLVRCTSPTAPWWEHRFCRDMIWLGTDDIITIVARHYRLEIDTMRAPTHAASWSIHATACHVYMHGTPTPWPWDRDCASNFIWIVSPDLVDRLILGHCGVDYWVVKTCMIGVVHACQPKGQQTHLIICSTVRLGVSYIVWCAQALYGPGVRARAVWPKRSRKGGECGAKSLDPWSLV